MSLHWHWQVSELKTWLCPVQESLASWLQSQPHCRCSTTTSLAHSFWQTPACMPHLPTMTDTSFSLVSVGTQSWFPLWQAPLHCIISTCVGVIWIYRNVTVYTLGPRYLLLRSEYFVITTCCMSVLLGRGSFTITGLGRHRTFSCNISVIINILYI